MYVLFYLRFGLVCFPCVVLFCLVRVGPCVFVCLVMGWFGFFALVGRRPPMKP